MHAHELWLRKGTSLLLLCAAVACNRSKEVATTASASAPPAPPPLLKDASRVLDPGDSAPLFSLLAHTGMATSLKRFASGPVVVLFCPTVSAESCQDSLLSLRDAWHGLRPKLSMVLGVTPEDRIRLREYAYANELPFLLLSDTDSAVTRAYGVGAAGSSGVQLFVISPQSKISARLADPSAEAVRQWLASL